MTSFPPWVFYYKKSKNHPKTFLSIEGINCRVLNEISTWILILYFIYQWAPLTIWWVSSPNYLGVDKDRCKYTNPICILKPWIVWYIFAYNFPFTHNTHGHLIYNRGGVLYQSFITTLKRHYVVRFFQLVSIMVSTSHVSLLPFFSLQYRLKVSYKYHDISP